MQQDRSQALGKGLCDRRKAAVRGTGREETRVEKKRSGIPPNLRESPRERTTSHLNPSLTPLSLSLRLTAHALALVNPATPRSVRESPKPSDRSGSHHPLAHRCPARPSPFPPLSPPTYSPPEPARAAGRQAGRFAALAAGVSHGGEGGTRSQGRRRGRGGSRRRIQARGLKPGFQAGQLESGATTAAVAGWVEEGGEGGKAAAVRKAAAPCAASGDTDLQAAAAGGCCDGVPQHTARKPAGSAHPLTQQCPQLLPLRRVGWSCPATGTTGSGLYQNPKRAGRLK